MSAGPDPGQGAIVIQKKKVIAMIVMLHGKDQVSQVLSFTAFALLSFLVGPVVEPEKFVREDLVVETLEGLAGWVVEFVGLGEEVGDEEVL